MADLKEELISIIVPVYNAARFIDETIRCVQSQSYSQWELIFVDDCSTDGSIDIICQKAAADKRIRFIEQSENGGAAKARNRGITEAEGRYICFLDADDLWLSEKLSKQLEYLCKLQQTIDESAGFVFTGYEFADEKGSGLGKIVHVPFSLTYSQALKNTTIFTSTVMIDRKRIPNDDIMMPLVASEDTATWWQILKKHKIGYGLDQNLVKYRRSADTLSANKFTAIKRIWGLYRKQEKLSILRSTYCMVFWAFRAVRRRL